MADRFVELGSISIACVENTSLKIGGMDSGLPE